MINPRDVEIPVAFLRECFIFNAEKGLLAWRARPREHFPSFEAWRKWNGRFAGELAFATSQYGYHRGGLSYNGKGYSLGAHRVLWALATGAWPKNQIDHRNGVRSDNRAANLREATAKENSHNVKKPSANTSGLTGVSRTRNGRWRAQIEMDGRGIHLGIFDAPIEARHAYLEAKARLHPFQPTQRDE